MAAIIIKSNNIRNLKLLTALAEQLGETVYKVNQSETLDIKLGKLMQKEKTNTMISRKSIFKHLDF